MKRQVALAGMCLIAVCVRGSSQTAAVATTQTVAPAMKAKKIPYYIDPMALRAATLLKAPPAQDSETTKAELALEHEMEATRTPQAVAAAQYDDAHEDIFLYGPVLGTGFDAEDLPLTAALSAHIRNDSGVVNAPLKTMFKRPRPYNFDTTLHAVCKTDLENSYPSGHAMVGYLMGLTVARMVPERAEAVLERADEYAQNRIVCGVHYPSDIEASRVVAYATFGSMAGSPRFQKELAAATAEVRHRLGLGELPVER